jgi:hypothetical protein
MTARNLSLRGQTFTTTPMRAIVVLAALVVAVSSATVALGAIGDSGVIQACYDDGGNVKVVSALPCPRGYTALGPVSTKAGADTAFLTQSAAQGTHTGQGGKGVGGGERPAPPSTIGRPPKHPNPPELDTSPLEQTWNSPT